MLSAARNDPVRADMAGHDAIARSRILRRLYAAGVILIPFNGIPGPGVLGELAHEASFLCFFPALAFASLLLLGGALAGTNRPDRGACWALWTGAALICCVGLSGLLNLPAMASATFHERAGLPKFATSTFVLLYGVGLAWLTARIAPGDWYRRLIVPACAGVLICLIVGLFEAAGLAGVRIAPFDAFYTFIHAGGDGAAVLWDGSPNLKLLDGWDKRLRSVLFEPPAFGTYAGLVWPWLLCGVAMARGRRRTIHAVLLAAFTGLIFVARARTGWLLLGCDLAALGALRFVFLPRDGRPDRRRIVATVAGGFAVVVAAAVYYLLSYDTLVAAVVSGDSVSDLTRAAYQVAAYGMFAANPLFGVGLGQFAFGAADYMPSWGFLSPEIRPSLIYPSAPWPNTYSIYARIAAELGLVGLLAWIGLWLATIVRVRRSALAAARRSIEHYAVIMAIAAIFGLGITDDSFRTPLIWITLGAASALIGATPASRQGPERRVDAGPTDDRAP